jgi:hypothetical protein
MFVKWIRQPLNNGLNGKRYQLTAFLDDGLNVKEYVKQGLLGTIEERFLNTKARDMRAFHQGLFWVVVDKNLGNLGLEADERQKIVAEISATVPIPSDEWALWGVVCCPKYDK